jgi:hypothetical protein
VRPFPGQESQGKTIGDIFDASMMLFGGATVRLRDRPTGRKDHVVKAARKGPKSIYIEFADGLNGEWSLSQLELSPANLKLDSIKAAPDKTHVIAETKHGETVHLDSSWLRAAIDPVFNADLEASLLALRG